MEQFLERPPPRWVQKNAPYITGIRGLQKEQLRYGFRLQRTPWNFDRSWSCDRRNLVIVINAFTSCVDLTFLICTFLGDLETNAVVDTDENLWEEYVQCPGWSDKNVEHRCLFESSLWKPMKACRKCRELKMCMETNKVKWYLRCHWRYQLEYGSF